MTADRIIVKPGECIDRATGNVVTFQSLPITPTEKVTAADPRWPEAVANNCGDQSHTFVQGADGEYHYEQP
jgi:hypothetical protein